MRTTRGCPSAGRKRVRQWFVHHGLGGLQYSVVGYGETPPVAPNNKPDGTDDPDGRTKNRRLEIVIAKRR